MNGSGLGVGTLWRRTADSCYVPHRLLNEIFAPRLMKPIWEAIGLLKGGPQLAKVGDDALRAVPKPWFSPSRQTPAPFHSLLCRHILPRAPSAIGRSEIGGRGLRAPSSPAPEHAWDRDRWEAAGKGVA